MKSKVKSGAKCRSVFPRSRNEKETRPAPINSMAFTRNGAFEYLSRAHENGRLAHAYLISGPPGSGKHGLASDLSNLVTGATVPDVFLSQPPGVYLAEPESKSRRIVIDQVRALEHALQMRSSD